MVQPIEIAGVALFGVGRLVIVAALYYSTAAISSGSPVGQAIRIRSNPSDTEGDTGGA